MTTDISEQTTKERILEAASVEFAERGFDGARVDEIAKRAGVNKALIYYYYKSKEELLNLLFLEAKDAVFQLLQSDRVESIDLTSKDAVRIMIYDFLDILEARQNVIRVMLMECAKRTPINDRIFAILGEVLEQLFKIPEKDHVYPNDNRPRAMVTEFFTGIMPVLDYVAYHEIWMERFSIDEPTLRKNFVESFMGTHFAYTVAGFPHEHGYTHRMG